jgi:hypothetical protein
MSTITTPKATIQSYLRLSTDTYQAALMLTTMSIYLTVRSHKLSLPTSTTGHFLAIVLPLILPIITYIFNHPTSSKLSLPISSNRRTMPFRLPIIPTAITILFMLDTALLTIASTALESSTFTCALETRWHQLFQKKNEGAVRVIQDAFDCCGLRTLVHEPWPFPPTPLRTCSERYNRGLACEGPWSTAGRGVWIGMVGVATANVTIKASH